MAAYVPRGLGARKISPVCCSCSSKPQQEACDNRVQLLTPGDALSYNEKNISGKPNLPF